jgi:hypothetical protein
MAACALSAASSVAQRVLAQRLQQRDRCHDPFNKQACDGPHRPRRSALCDQAPFLRQPNPARVACVVVRGLRHTSHCARLSTSAQSGRRGRGDCRRQTASDCDAARPAAVPGTSPAAGFPVNLAATTAARTIRGCVQPSCYAGAREPSSGTCATGDAKSHRARAATCR